MLKKYTNQGPRHDRSGENSILSPLEVTQRTTFKIGEGAANDAALDNMMPRSRQQRQNSVGSRSDIGKIGKGSEKPPKGKLRQHRKSGKVDSANNSMNRSQPNLRDNSQFSDELAG